MSVHPNYSGRGVGKQLVNYILDYTKENNYKSCRLVSSAINMDKRNMVEQMYSWDAINVETHLKEVWGEFLALMVLACPVFYQKLANTR